jgi:hypothetical protein
MGENIDTIIVGGGPAGLAVSYFLSRHGRQHVVLEKSDRPGNAWRNHRWGSFCLNTPNWQTRLPGAEYQGNDPDGFMTRDEVVEYLEQYVEAFQLPVRFCIHVTRVEQNSRCQSYLISTNRGASACARNVVVATGLIYGAIVNTEFFGPPVRIFSAIAPRHSIAVAQSKVFWKAAYISGKDGGRTLNLHQFARDGVVLLGHLQGVEGEKIILAPDLKENLAKADKFEADFVKAVDGFIAETGIDVPEETLPVLRHGFDAPVLLELNLRSADITNVIWATSYNFDFSFVKLPVLDADGFPVQARGVTKFPGLYFGGLPWLHNAKSGLLYGVGDDAAFISQRIGSDERSVSEADLQDSPEDGWLSHDFCAA